MKALVPFVLLVCLSPLASSASLTLQGDGSSGRYALSLKGDALSITLSSDATLTHSRILLPLGSGWTLTATEGSARVHYPSLASKRMRAVTLSHPAGGISALFDNEGGGGVSLQGGPLSVALFSFVPLPSDSLFVRYREVHEGVVVLARVQDEGRYCGLDWELSYGSTRSVAVTTSLWVGVGPLTLVERFGPSVGEREKEVRLAMEARHLSSSLSVITALGGEAIYSGQFQEKRQTISSSLKASLGPYRMQFTFETVLRFLPGGTTTRRQTLDLTLARGRWHLSLRWRIGSTPTYLFGSGTDFLSLRGQEVSASFVHSEGPWRFTLQFGHSGTVSLLWLYTITIDRGSESPRQGR